MKIWRIVLATVGLAVALYGVSQLLTKIPPSSLVLLGLWLVGALVIHDGLLSPAVVGVGSVLRRSVPDRGRRYLQIGLIMAAMITVPAVWMIIVAGREPPSKAMLLQDYGANLTVLLALVAAATLVSYAVRVARDRSAPAQPAATDRS